MNKINSKKYTNSKKAQFYIISSIIIILVITTLASVTNYVSIKPEPEKFYDLADILSLEGKYVIDNANYKLSGNISSQIQTYLELYASYLAKNTEADFNLIILYGNLNSENITIKMYSRSSLGNININLGNTTFSIQGGNNISERGGEVTTKVDNNKKKVKITIASTDSKIKIEQEVPVLENNNFIFIMTTNDDFNQYVQTNLNPKPV